MITAAISRNLITRGLASAFMRLILKIGGLKTFNYLFRLWWLVVFEIHQHTCSKRPKNVEQNNKYAAEDSDSVHEHDASP